MAFCFLNLQLGIAHIIFLFVLANTALHTAKDPVRLVSYIYLDS